MASFKVAWGLGTAGFGGVYEKVNTTSYSHAEQVILAALQESKATKELPLLVDTAPWYMKSEQVVGQALQNIFESTEYDREHVVIATKVGRYRSATTAQGRFDYSKNTLLESIESSLQKLRIEKIDIIYLHDVEFGMETDEQRQQTIQDLLQMRRDTEWFRFLGVAGYPLEALDKFVQYVDIVQTYCHLTLQACNRFEYYLHKWRANKKDLIVTSASPLAMGLLTTSGPCSWHPASASLRSFCMELGSRYADLIPIALTYAVVKATELNVVLVSGCTTVEHVEMLETARRLDETMKRKYMQKAQEIQAEFENNKFLDFEWESGTYEENEWNVKSLQKI